MCFPGELAPLCFLWIRSSLDPVLGLGVTSPRPSVPQSWGACSAGGTVPAPGEAFPALQGGAVPVLTPARELHPFQTVGKAELCSFPPLWHILKLAIPFWILSAHSPSSPQGPAFFQYSSHVAYFYSVEQLLMFHCRHDIAKKKIHVAVSWFSLILLHTARP